MNLIKQRRNCKPTMADFGRYFHAPMETPDGVFPMIGVCEKDGVIHLGRAHRILKNRIVWYDWFQCTLLLYPMTQEIALSVWSDDELRAKGFYTSGLAECIYKLID